MSLLKRKCIHSWFAYKRSNALQLDSTGCPTRLFICRCKKCGEYKQMWLDVQFEEAEELKTGESVLISWDTVEW